MKATKYLLTVENREGKTHERISGEPRITERQKNELGWKLIDSRSAVEGKDYVDMSYFLKS